MPQHLFSFATTRNVAALPETTRRRFHILIQDADRDATHYWSDLVRGDNSATLIAVIRSRAASAPVMPRLGPLVAEFSAFMQIFRDAKSEERRASLEGLIALIDTLNSEPLQRAQRVRLWDILAHHIFVAADKDIVDTVRAIFVANQLIETRRLAEEEAPETQLETDLRRASEARVVLPLSIVNPRDRDDDTGPTDFERGLLEGAHDQILAERDVEELSAARAEIETLALRSAADRRNQTESERTEAEARIVDVLSSTLNARAIEAVLPALRSSLPAAVAPVHTSFFDFVAREAAPTTLQQFRRFQPQGVMFTAQETLAQLDDEIEARDATLTGAVTSTDVSTFMIFGAEIVVEEVIPDGLAIFKVLRAPEGGFHVYMTYHTDDEAAPIGEIGGDITTNGVSMPVRETLIGQDNPAFQTFRLTDEPIVASAFDLDLTFRSAAEDASAVSLDLFRLYSNAPRFRMIDLDPFDQPALAPRTLFGVNRLGVIDYRRVEQEVSCYVTGEVSRIENIMASEFKERISRQLNTVESEDEVTQEISSEHQSDTETSKRDEMQAEVRSALNEQWGLSVDTGVSVDAKFPGGNINSYADFNYNSQTSREEATSQAIKTAKSITQRVQEKLVQKATSRRRSLSRREFEDINKHGFDNRQNTDHVVGIFRWVDKIMTNRLVNYGLMNVLEFEIPEPARNFIRAQRKVQRTAKPTIESPKTPEELGLTGPNRVRRGNWRHFAAAYDVDIAPPPLSRIRVAKAYADGPMTAAEDDTTSYDPYRRLAYNDIEIPTDYVTRRAWVEGSSNGLESTANTDLGSFPQVGTTQASVGGSALTRIGDWPEEGVELPPVAGVLPVTVVCNNVAAFGFTVVVNCVLRAVVYKSWQMETYEALMRAYHKKREAYEAAQEAYKDAQDDVDLNPRFKKMHMERELKRICIEMLTQPFGLETTANHYIPAPKRKLLKLRQDPALDRHAEIVRFFEHAFWWELMAYSFYPYFYAKRRRWTAKLTMEATRSELFGSFLSAGMSRVMVPIRPGFEEAVMFFMQTGEVWFGQGFVVDSENDLYLSIADEMSQRRDLTEVVEDTWQTRLPTNHTILQSAAAAMIGEGLPCEIAEDRIGVGSSVLSPVLPPVPAEDP